MREEVVRQRALKHGPSSHRLGIRNKTIHEADRNDCAEPNHDCKLSEEQREHKEYVGVNVNFEACDAIEAHAAFDLALALEPFFLCAPGPLTWLPLAIIYTPLGVRMVRAMMVVVRQGV